MNSKTGLVTLALTAGLASGCMYRHSAAETAYMANRFEQLQENTAICGMVNGWNSGIMSLRDRCVGDAQEQYDLYQIPEVRQMFPRFDCVLQYGCIAAGNGIDCPSDGGICSITDENGNVIAGGEQ